MKKNKKIILFSLAVSLFGYSYFVYNKYAYFYAPKFFCSLNSEYSSDGSIGKIFNIQQIRKNAILFSYKNYYPEHLDSSKKTFTNEVTFSPEQFGELKVAFDLSEANCETLKEINRQAKLKLELVRTIPKPQYELKDFSKLDIYCKIHDSDPQNPSFIAYKLKNIEHTNNYGPYAVFYKLAYDKSTRGLYIFKKDGKEELIQIAEKNLIDYFNGDWVSGPKQCEEMVTNLVEDTAAYIQKRITPNEYICDDGNAYVFERFEPDTSVNSFDIPRSRAVVKKLRIFAGEINEEKTSIFSNLNHISLKQLDNYKYGTERCKKWFKDEFELKR